MGKQSNAGRCGWILALLALVAWPSEPLLAQTDAEYLSVFNFRFSNPGARAKAMGGALVALADDDATAAFVNPAGLAFFDQQQVSVEYAYEEDEFLSPRRETGLTLDGNPAGPPRRRTIENDSSFPSFASYVRPLEAFEIGFSIFYARLLDAETGVDVFLDSAYFPEIDPELAFRPVSSSVSGYNHVFGASLGRRLGESLAVGVAIGVSELDFEGVARRGELFDADEIVNTQSSTVDAEVELFVTVGGLWRISERWTAGVSWQKETSYRMDNEFIVVDGTGQLDRRFETDFTIPTRIAAGLVYRSDRWVVAFEADRIQYSDLFAGSNEATFFGEFEDDPSYGYAIEDVTELHVGVERSFTTAREGESWSLRVGAWRDSTHTPYYSGDDPLLAAWAPQLDDDIYHWTAGVGLERERFALGLAADFSDDAGTDLLASALFKF